MKIGVDIIEVEEVRRLIADSSGAFLHRTFTAAEIAYCQKKPMGMYQSYAGKLAAKEAFMKAMGTGWSKGLQWGDIEVLNDPIGKPFFLLSASAQCILEEKGGGEVALSISHTQDQAIAFVIIATG